MKNLNLQVEFNSVRPHTYQGKDTGIGFYHYNQSLAHPMGANFSEVLVMASYQWKRIYCNYTFNYTQAGFDRDTTTNRTLNFGNTIMDTDNQIIQTNGVKIGNGSAYSVINNELKFGYILNPKINMCVAATMQFRKYNFSHPNIDNLKSRAISLHFSTNIFNRYYDLPILF